MRSLMLEITPAAGERRVLSKAMIAARALSVGPVCMAQRKNIQSDMQNAANALLNISTSASPSAKELSAMSCWMLMFHKRCENFQHVIMDTETMPASSSASSARGSSAGRRNLFGAEALQYRLERCKKVPDGHQDEQDLKELRQFKWMLSDIELKAVEDWTRAKVVSSKDKIMNRQRLCETWKRKPMTNSALVIVQTSLSWLLLLL